MDNFVANNGTQAGCEAKKAHCSLSANACNGHGQCVDAWRGYVCHCDDHHAGQNCLHTVDEEAVKHFRGDGHLSFVPNLQPLAYPWLVTFDVKTQAQEAIILAIQLGQSNMVKFELSDGRLQFSLDNFAPLRLEQVELSDGRWHHVEVRWLANGVTLSLDYGQHTVHGHSMGGSVDILGLYIAKVVVGGHDTPDELTGQ